MTKRKIIAEPIGAGQYRKRAYCAECNKRVGLYQKTCHHCGTKLDGRQ